MPTKDPCCAATEALHPRLKYFPSQVKGVLPLRCTPGQHDKQLFVFLRRKWAASESL
jgi:hypothetical protein